MAALNTGLIDTRRFTHMLVSIDANADVRAAGIPSRYTPPILAYALALKLSFDFPTWTDTGALDSRTSTNIASKANVGHWKGGRTHTAPTAAAKLETTPTTTKTAKRPEDPAGPGMVPIPSASWALDTRTDTGGRRTRLLAISGLTLARELTRHSLVILDADSVRSTKPAATLGPPQSPSPRSLDHQPTCPLEFVPPSGPARSLPTSGMQCSHWGHFAARLSPIRHSHPGAARHAGAYLA